MELKVGRNDIEPALAVLATALTGYYLGAAIYANLILRSPFVGAGGSVGDWEGLFAVLGLLFGIVLATVAIFSGVGLAGMFASLIMASGLAVVMAWLPIRNPLGRTVIAAMVGAALGGLAFTLVATLTVDGLLGRAAALSTVGAFPGLAAGVVMGLMTQPKAA